MYEQETIKPYNSGEKAEQVEQMFDNIAPTYDRLNHRLSWNIDRYWRRKALRQLQPCHPRQLLDIATGTGDLAIQAVKMMPDVKVTAVDISEQMMKIGQEKVQKAGLAGSISFDKQDCTHLTIPDASYDAVTAAFGIRNFADLDKGLSEMCRVLRKGGHLCIIELTTMSRSRILFIEYRFCLKNVLLLHESDLLLQVGYIPTFRIRNSN